MKVEFSRRAERDLENILNFVAGENPEAAKRLSRAIFHTIDVAVTRPYIGIRNARSRELRSRLVVGYPYRVHYLIREQGIFVVHIRHTARRPWPSG